MKRNINGLSYREWLAAAGKNDDNGIDAVYWDAWKAGEDPCDWKGSHHE